MATRRAALTPDEVFLTPEQAAEQTRLALAAAVNAEPDDDMMTPADRVALMLNDARDDDRAVVKLYKRGTGNKIEWCADYSIADFEAGGLEMIRRDWGAGDFEVRLYGIKPGTNAFVVRAKSSVSIKERAYNPANPIAAPQGNNTDLVRMMEKMMESINNRPEPPPPVDPMTQMMTMFTMMKTMKEVMGGDNAQTGMVQALQALRELKGAAKELLPPDAGEEKEPSMMQMAGEMLPMFKAALMPQQSQQPALQQPQQIMMPATFAHAAPPVEYAANPVDPNQQDLPLTDPNQIQQPQNDDEEMNRIQQMMFNALLNKIIKMAVEKKDPDDAADYIEANAPGQVVEFLETDEWWTTLVAIRPDIEPHKEWLFKVRASLIEGGEESEVAK